MSDQTFWADYGVPIIGLAFSAFALSIAWLSSWDFDRRYGPGSGNGPK